MLNSAKVKSLIVLLFTSLVLTAANAGLCQPPNQDDILNNLPTHSQKSDIVRRSIWTILAFACLCTGVYILYVSWKNSESFNDDFEIDFNNTQGSGLKTPTNINEAIRMFLRKMR